MVTLAGALLLGGCAVLLSDRELADRSREIRERCMAETSLDGRRRFAAEARCAMPRIHALHESARRGQLDLLDVQLTYDIVLGERLDRGEITLAGATYERSMKTAEINTIRHRRAADARRERERDCLSPAIIQPPLIALPGILQPPRPAPCN
jgi:hypothetical protein